MEPGRYWGGSIKLLPLFFRYYSGWFSFINIKRVVGILEKIQVFSFPLPVLWPQTL
jgi:hypothetical protein